jgi:hypothetical protein
MSRYPALVGAAKPWAETSARMRSTETAPILVAAKRAIHEAPAAAELTTDDRVWRVRLAVLLGFATIAFTFWRTLELLRSFLKHA